MEPELNSNAQAAALSQLFKDLGIDTLSQEKQNELVIKMTEVLLKRIFLETMDKLGEKGREEYEELTKGEIQPQQAEMFLKERIQNYDEMVRNIILEFKTEMMQAKS